MILRFINSTAFWGLNVSLFLWGIMWVFYLPIDRIMLAVRFTAIVYIISWALIMIYRLLFPRQQEEESKTN